MILEKRTTLLVLVMAVSTARCSVVAPVLAPAPITYTQIAPPNIPPYAASVSTFTRGLNVYAAPYAAGLLPRAILPGPAVLPPPGFAPGPLPVAPRVFPGAAPFAPVAGPPPALAGGYAVAPPPVAVGHAHAVAPPPFAVGPAPFAARSVHGWAPPGLEGFAHPPAFLK